MKQEGRILHIKRKLEREGWKILREHSGLAATKNQELRIYDSDGNGGYTKIQLSVFFTEANEET